MGKRLLALVFSSYNTPFEMSLQVMVSLLKRPLYYFVTNDENMVFNELISIETNSYVKNFEYTKQKNSF